MPEVDCPRASVASLHPTAPSANGTSYLALIGGAIAIGFAPIFVRLSEVGPVSTAMWRVIIAVPMLWTIAGFVRQDRSAVPGDEPAFPLPADPSTGRWMMIIAGLFFAADLAVWHWSIRFTSVANSTLLANFAPVFVVLYALFAHGHRTTRRFLFAMLIALAGMALLIGRDFRLDQRALFGDVLGIVTAIFYAGYLISIKSLRGQFPTVIIMARTALVTAIALLPIALISGETLLPRTLHGWVIVAGLALVSHVGGQTLITYALAKLPASVASVTLLVQPVTATLAAAVLLAEPIALFQVIGMVFVLAGVFVARQEA